MSNIEPTEEQKQAASDHVYDTQWWDNDGKREALAQLLAEREAKLTTSIMEMWVAERTQSNERYDTLRARVAELEARVEGLLAVTEEDQMRVAQHLADIKALMGCCRGLVHDVDRLMCGIDVGRHAMVMRATLKRLAHYDDAKAAEGGEA